MEKWKIAVILLLVTGFVGFQWMQSSNGSSSNGSNDATASPTATPTPDPKLTKLLGTQFKPWNIPANLWMNTKKPLTLADLKGHVTLIEFFRIQCPHCEESVPMLLKIGKEMSVRGLKIISFQSPGLLTDPENPELSWPAVQQWAKSHGIKYPVAFDTNRKFKDQFGIEFYPLILLVDAKGRIIFAQSGHTPEKEDDLVAALIQAMSNR